MSHFVSSSRGRSRPFVVVGALLIIVGAGATFAYGSTRQSGPSPDGTVSYVASTTGAVVKGQNNGTGVASEGVVGASAGSIGMLGLANSLTHGDVGMEGLVWGPSSTGLYGQGLKNTDTTHPSVGLLGTSTSGIGVEGESLTSAGAGVFGEDQTGGQLGELGINAGAGVLGQTNSGSFVTPGIDGESINSNVFNSAASFGIDWEDGAQSFAPYYGVVAYGSAYGIQGLDTGNGSSQQIGVYGDDFTGNTLGSDLNVGIWGNSLYGTGIVGAGDDESPTVAGAYPIGIYGVSSTANSGAGVSVANWAEALDTNTYAVFAYNNANDSDVSLLPSGTDLIDAAVGAAFFTLSSAGSINISGTITTSGLCSGGCAGPRERGRKIVRYASEASVPTVEDFGEAQLTDGAASVRLEPRFASTIQTENYYVFLTPEGDNRGLYVTDRTPTGFSVREAEGGRSSIAFMYRIVGKPYGDNSPRLPIVDTSLARPADRLVAHRIARPETMSAGQALIAHYGRARAMQMLAQARAETLARQKMIKNLPYADHQGRLHLTSSVVIPANPQ